MSTVVRIKLLGILQTERSWITTLPSNQNVVNPFQRKVGWRSGVPINKGKKIRKNPDGFENFDDYWSESEAESIFEISSVQSEDEQNSEAVKNKPRIKPPINPPPKNGHFSKYKTKAPPVCMVPVNPFQKKIGRFSGLPIKNKKEIKNANGFENLSVLYFSPSESEESTFNFSVNDKSTNVTLTSSQESEKRNETAECTEQSTQEFQYSTLQTSDYSTENSDKENVGESRLDNQSLKPPRRSLLDLSQASNIEHEQLKSTGKSFLKSRKSIHGKGSISEIDKDGTLQNESRNENSTITTETSIHENESNFSEQRLISAGTTMSVESKSGRSQRHGSTVESQTEIETSSLSEESRDDDSADEKDFTSVQTQTLECKSSSRVTRSKRKSSVREQYAQQSEESLSVTTEKQTNSVLLNTESESRNSIDFSKTDSRKKEMRTVGTMMSKERNVKKKRRQTVTVEIQTESFSEESHSDHNIDKTFTAASVQCQTTKESLPRSRRNKQQEDFSIQTQEVTSSKDKSVIECEKHNNDQDTSTCPENSEIIKDSVNSSLCATKVESIEQNSQITCENQSSNKQKTAESQISQIDADSQNVFSGSEDCDVAQKSVITKKSQMFSNSKTKLSSSSTNARKSARTQSLSTSVQKASESKASCIDNSKVDPSQIEDAEAVQKSFVHEKSQGRPNTGTELSKTSCNARKSMRGKRSLTAAQILSLTDHYPSSEESSSETSIVIMDAADNRKSIGRLKPPTQSSENMINSQMSYNTHKLSSLNVAGDPEGSITNIENLSLSLTAPPKKIFHTRKRLTYTHEQSIDAIPKDVVEIVAADNVDSAENSVSQEDVAKEGDLQERNVEENEAKISPQVECSNQFENESESKNTAVSSSSSKSLTKGKNASKNVKNFKNASELVKQTIISEANDSMNSSQDEHSEFLSLNYIQKAKKTDNSLVKSKKKTTSNLNNTNNKSGKKMSKNAKQSNRTIEKLVDVDEIFPVVDKNKEERLDSSVPVDIQVRDNMDSVKGKKKRGRSAKKTNRSIETSSVIEEKSIYNESDVAANETEHTGVTLKLDKESGKDMTRRDVTVEDISDEIQNHKKKGRKRKRDLKKGKNAKACSESSTQANETHNDANMDSSHNATLRNETQNDAEVDNIPDATDTDTHKVTPQPTKSSTKTKSSKPRSSRTQRKDRQSKQTNASTLKKLKKGERSLLDDKYEEENTFLDSIGTNNSLPLQNSCVNPEESLQAESSQNSALSVAESESTRKRTSLLQSDTESKRLRHSDISVGDTEQEVTNDKLTPADTDESANASENNTDNCETIISAADDDCTSIYPESVYDYDTSRSTKSSAYRSYSDSYSTSFSTSQNLASDVEDESSLKKSANVETPKVGRKKSLSSLKKSLLSQSMILNKEDIKTNGLRNSRKSAPGFFVGNDQFQTVEKKTWPRRRTIAIGRNCTPKNSLFMMQEMSLDGLRSGVSRRYTSCSNRFEVLSDENRTNCPDDECSVDSTTVETPAIEMEETTNLTPCLVTPGSKRKKQSRRVTISEPQSIDLPSHDGPDNDVFENSESRDDHASNTPLTRTPFFSRPANEYTAETPVVVGRIHDLSPEATYAFSMSESPVHLFETTNSLSPEVFVMPQRESQKIIHPETAPPGVRRSQRTRVQTLEWYKNERVLYDRRKSGGLCVSAIQPSREMLYLAQEKLKKPKNGKKKKRKRNLKGINTPRNVSIHEEFPSELDFSMGTGIVVMHKSSETEVLVDCLAYNDMNVYVNADGNEPTNSDPYIICVKLDQRAFRTGNLIIRPLSEKPLQQVTEGTLLYEIRRGKVAVTIHKTTRVCEAGDEFFIPDGNVYSIKNLRKDEAKLSFKLLKS